VLIGISFYSLEVTGKHSLNWTLRSIDVEILIVILLVGFIPRFGTINQSQALVKSNLSLVNIIRTNDINNTIQSFHIAYETLINDSHSLTQSYQSQISKWLSKQYDNKTMILITDKYLPEFHRLVSRAQALQPTTTKYLQAKDLYIKSLQSEIGSYRHFRNFLVMGNNTEDNISTQLLTNALKYEINSFAAFNNRTVTETENNNNNNYGNETFSPTCENDQSPYTCV
jgi:hypothetical protein